MGLRLIEWLLKRVARRDFDDVKLYCTEVLVILLQGSDANQAQLGSSGGIDVLLESVAVGVVLLCVICLR